MSNNINNDFLRTPYAMQRKSKVTSAEISSCNLLCCCIQFCVSYHCLYKPSFTRTQWIYFHAKLHMLKASTRYTISEHVLLLEYVMYLPYNLVNALFCSETMVCFVTKRNKKHLHFMTNHLFCHCTDVIIDTIPSQITSFTIVYSTVYSDADIRKYQSSALLAFVRGIHRIPVNSPHKWPVTRKMFPFDDIIMWGCLLWWSILRQLGLTYISKLYKDVYTKILHYVFSTTKIAKKPQNPPHHQQNLRYRGKILKGGIIFVTKVVHIIKQFINISRGYWQTTYHLNHCEHIVK